MAEEKTQQNSSPMTVLPLMALLAILASWFFTYPTPYQDERPSSRPLQARYAAAQDVDARLWQDPFAAVDGASEETPTEKVFIVVNQKGETQRMDATMRAADSSSHTLGQIYNDETLTAGDKITILAVTLQGGPYQEAAEDRMRRRYAVLSALANQGFVPQDAQHIGYFRPELKMDLQKRVPFEWWSLQVEKSTSGDQLPQGHKNKVLLLWVDESSLLGCPAAKLNELLRQASQGERSKGIVFNYTVIGPNTSTLLRDMLQEVKGDKKRAPVARCISKSVDNYAKSELGEINGQDIIYYSAGATASDEDLLKDIESWTKGKTVSGQLGQGVKLYRTTATDNAMMRILVNELCVRKVKKTDHIVILSEWDTFYGRAMPKAFETEWVKNGGDKNTAHTFSYMRGLDGKLPDKSDKASSAAEKKSASKEKSANEALIELPEGQSQKDYLRRLTDHLLELDQQLKAKDNQMGVAAIGVLGSDVHDKLMILEALRLYFPHKLFFTTDLDASYRHPAKWPQTHNLLVASAFDLKLRPELQGTIPPFRDSYQTALFFATQMALNTLLVNPDYFPPRLFEIGRRHSISLPTIKDRVLPVTENMVLSEDNKDKCSWSRWWVCNNNVQPPIYATYQFNWTWGVMFVLSLVIMPPLVSWWVRKRWREYLRGIGVVLLLAFLFLKLFWNNYITKPEAEPFYWLEGLSIWPSQLLRLSALLFAVGFYLWGRMRIQRMHNEFQAPPSLHNHEPIFALPADSYWVLVRDAIFVGSWTEVNSEEMVSPDVLWKKYLGYCCFPGSLLRVLVHGLAFFIMAALIIAISSPPNAPTRGDFAERTNFVILPMVIVVTILLTMWVVENARLCRRLINNLSAKPSQWNKIARDWAICKNEVARECVNDWLDIQLIARLTETIQLLIWGPMVCIVLLVLARSPVIDDWDMPWGLGMVFIAMLLYAISAEVFLQRGANEAREKSIDQLTRKIIVQRNQSEPNEAVIKRIEAEIERIKMLRKGAFRPWYEWPLLHSFGGLSSLVFVLQYFAEVWEKGSF
jgi:hypothetical protein